MLSDIRIYDFAELLPQLGALKADLAF